MGNRQHSHARDATTTSSCASCFSAQTEQTIETDASAALSAIETRLQALEAAFKNGTVSADLNIVLADGQDIVNVLLTFIPELIAVFTNNPAVLTNFSNFMTSVETILSKTGSSLTLMNSLIVALLNVGSSATTTTSTATTATTSVATTSVATTSAATVATKAFSATPKTMSKAEAVSKIGHVLSINCPTLTKNISTDVSAVGGFIHLLTTTNQVFVNNHTSADNAGDLLDKMTAAAKNVK